jgi:alkanesulfonate monooxygenase SsuD/methylene tetrahydromethanopterin reductase-like flavin-dependent oxidoreductase (luciferase family)
MAISLAYLADHSQRIHFGPLVAPVSFRDPMLLARQAAAIDDLSGGRLWLGLGAGWQDREHTLFGYDLGDVPTRMARLEEGLEVVSRLMRSDQPVSFEGHFYQLREATLLPRPQRPGGPRIMIGGNGPRRTLPLAARYADVWNATFRAPGDFQMLTTRLDELARGAGRLPGDIRRTMMTSLFFGSDQAALARKVGDLGQRVPDLAGKPLDALVSYLRNERNAIAGTADAIAEQIAAYAAVGVEELMLQWFDLDDIDGLRTFAKQVLPQL